ncbi:cyclophilin-like fold protein [Myroides odoratimimus]|uniref:cyclophilin-like fold protein n=1 Tax=Myroides odoratimimus TaxID=76832 RepID=UPI000A54B2D6|nr:cyclophilin-like fold protein [Myroides odoratimimus]
MKKLIYLVMLFSFSLQTYGCTPKNSSNTVKAENTSETENLTDTTQNKKDMKVKISIGDKTATAVLYDNATGRDFAKRLPLTVEMEDYSSTEKIFYPKTKFSTEGAPAGFDPSVGDLTVYVPWGNVALFYKDFGYSNGLVSFGKITSGMEHLKVKGSVNVKFELVEE